MQILESIQDENLKKELSSKFGEYETKLKDLNSKFEEAIETRQKAKERARELEERIASGNAESKDLLNSKTKEIDNLTSQMETIKAEAESYKKKYTDFENETKKEILETIPEGELREIATKLDLMDLRRFAEAVKKESIKKEQGFRFGASQNTPAKSLQEWRAKLNT